MQPMPINTNQTTPPSSTNTGTTTVIATSPTFIHKPSTTKKRKYDADEAVTAVTGATLGSICAYVQRYGTPYQSKRVLLLVDKLLDLQKVVHLQNKSSVDDGQTRKEKRSKNDQQHQVQEEKEVAFEDDCDHFDPDTIEWSRLKQELYNLTGPFLWKHAVYHWRTCIAPKMKIPVALQDEVLKVETEHDLDGEEDKEKSDEGGGPEKDEKSRGNKDENSDEKNAQSKKEQTTETKNKSGTVASAAASVWKGWSLALPPPKHSATPTKATDDNINNKMEHLETNNKNIATSSIINVVQSSVPTESVVNDKSIGASSPSQSETPINHNTTKPQQHQQQDVTTTSPSILMPPPPDVANLSSTSPLLPQPSSSSLPTDMESQQIINSQLKQSKPLSTQEIPQKLSNYSSSMLQFLPDNKGFINFAEYDFGTTTALPLSATIGTSHIKNTKQQQLENIKNHRKKEEKYKNYFQENWSLSIHQQDEKNKNGYEKNQKLENQDVLERNSTTNIVSHHQHQHQQPQPHHDDKNKARINKEFNEGNMKNDIGTLAVAHPSSLASNTRKRKRIDYSNLTKIDDVSPFLTTISTTAAAEDVESKSVKIRCKPDFVSNYAGVYRRYGGSVVVGGGRSNSGDVDDHHHSIQGFSDDEDDKHEHSHPPFSQQQQQQQQRIYWIAQCLMRCGRKEHHSLSIQQHQQHNHPMKYKKSPFFYIGKYNTEKEAAFAVDLMQTFFHPELKQHFKEGLILEDASLISAADTASTILDELGESKVSPLTSTTTTTKTMDSAQDKNSHIETISNRRTFKLNLSTIKECEEIWTPYLDDYGWLRTVDVVDIKLRPALRKIVHTAVLKWSSSSNSASDGSCSFGQQLYIKKEVIKDDNAKRRISTGLKGGKEKGQAEQGDAEEKAVTEDCKEGKSVKDDSMANISTQLLAVTKQNKRGKTKDKQRIKCEERYMHDGHEKNANNHSDEEKGKHNNEKNEARAIDLDEGGKDSAIIINDNNSEQNDMKMVDNYINSSSISDGKQVAGKDTNLWRHDQLMNECDGGDDDIVLVDDGDVVCGSDDDGKGNDDIGGDDCSSSSIAVVEDCSIRDSSSSSSLEEKVPSNPGLDGANNSDDMQKIDVIDLS